MSFIDLTPIFQALIALCTTVITVCAIPFVKNKLSAQRTDELLKWVKIGVAAAEQLAKANEWTGSEKFNFARDFLRQKGLYVDPVKARNAIEAAVLELHSRLDGKE